MQSVFDEYTKGKDDYKELRKQLEDKKAQLFANTKGLDDDEYIKGLLKEGTAPADIDDKNNQEDDK